MCSPFLLVFVKDFLNVRRWAGLLLALTAMGGSVPVQAVAAPTSGRFELLRMRDLRVATVAYRLSTTNAPLCARLLTPALGFTLHGIEQYAPADRVAAARIFALGENVGVMGVVSGSPAERAGLRAGDQLVSVNGRDLGIHVQGDTPTRASVDTVQRLLVDAMRRGAVSLRVTAGEKTRDVQFAAAQGCPSTVELIPGAALNAWADGGRVMVSEGLLDKCLTDDDLALVIGHELAHNLLHHRRRLAAEGIVANSLLPMTGAASQAIRDTEEEADRTGVALATAAGYDLAGAPSFLGTLFDPAVAVAATHPDATRRLLLLRTAIDAARLGRERRSPFSG